jgi:glycosyltransferase involved in cell wall biosynthesis
MKIQSQKCDILYLITKSNWGGAQKYVFENVTDDIRSGKDVCVALGGDGELRHRLEKEDVKVLEIKNLNRDISILKDFKVSLEIYKIYKKLQPTEVRLNSSKIGILGSVVARKYNFFHRRNIKIQFTAHGWVFNEDRSWLSRFTIKFLSYLTILASHKVTVLSKFEYDQVSHWPLAKHKFEIKPLELKEVDFIPQENARDFFRKNIQIKDTKWIVTIAELHKNKGLEYGIKALSKIQKDFIWIIIGDGEEKDNLEKLIKENDLKDNIIIFGYLKDAYKYLKAFDIFLLPSIKEGLPYVLLEAEKANLPIIATEVGGIREYFDINDNIIVKPKDVIAIEKAINQMLD